MVKNFVARAFDDRTVQLTALMKDNLKIPEGIHHIMITVLDAFGPQLTFTIMNI